jgi:hypothetical protein
MGQISRRRIEESFPDDDNGGRHINVPFDSAREEIEQAERGDCFCAPRLPILVL